MFETKRKHNKGFTLIELLVVIAIIGLLASVVMISLANSRIRSRDVKRKSDIDLIVKAVEFYAQQNGSYAISGGGNSGAGQGWFNYQNGTSYVTSIANALINSGVINTAPRDPSLSSDNQTPQYMLYRCGNGFYAYAKLEDPSAEDLATYTSSKTAGCVNLDIYGMNYARGHK